MLDLPQFAPDIYDSVFDNMPISNIVENLFPHITGYESVPSFKVISDASITEDVIGSISVIRANDTHAALNIIGTANKIYKYGPKINNDGTISLGYQDISRAGGYSISDNTEWSFAVFGEYVIAVNPHYPLQYLDMSEIDGKFKDLAEAPRAHKVKVWGNYVALIGILDEASSNLDMIAWSGLNDLKDWNFGDRASDSDKQRLYDGGQVLNATSSESPYIFLRNKVYKATYNPSSNLIFTIRSINFDGGIKAVNSLVEANGVVFFYSDRGFYKISPDGSIVNIGKDRVNQWISKLIKNDDDTNLVGYYSPDSTRVYWAIRSGYSLHQYNMILVYDYLLDRWSYISVTFRHLINYTSFSYGLEDLDLISTLDKLPASLDSKIWVQDSPVLTIIDSEGKMRSSTGSAMQARIVSNIISSGDNQFITLKSVMLNSSITSYSTKAYYKASSYEEWRSGQSIFPGFYRNSVLYSIRGRFFKILFEIMPQDKDYKFWVNKYQYEVGRAGWL